MSLYVYANKSLFKQVYFMLIVEYFNCLDSMVTNDARWTREIKSRIAMAKAEFSRKRISLTCELDVDLRKNLVKCYIWSTTFYGAESWTFRKGDQK